MTLTLSNIKKYFGEKLALDIEQYTVNDGEIIGLVGNNGACKTTMFRAILDLIKPEEGAVSIDGINPAENIQPDKVYQISIINNLGVYAEF